MGNVKCCHVETIENIKQERPCYLQRRMELLSNASLQPVPELSTDRTTFFLEEISLWKVHMSVPSRINRIQKNIERVMELPNNVYILKPTRLKRMTRYRLAIRMPYGHVDFFDYLMQPLDMEKVHKHLKHMAESILWLHGQGLAHRDIKPENFVLHSYGHFRLIDFDFTDSIHQISICGTKNYAVTPRVVASWGCKTNMAIRADVYSFGKLLLFTLQCAAEHGKIRKGLAPLFRDMFLSNFVESEFIHLKEPAATWFRVAKQCCRGTPPLGIPRLSIVRPHVALVT